jgi:hypothetical protein
MGYTTRSKVLETGKSVASVLAIAALIAVLGVTVSGCGAEGESGREGGEVRSSDGAPVDALSQMEVGFVGNPSREEVRDDLDKAFRLYDVPVTEENYSRAGSSLVGLRKKTGVPETDILAHAITLHTPRVSLDLPDAFGLAASEIELSSGGS